MRLRAFLLVVLLAPPALAEESAFPKWKLAAGDRFTLEYTIESTRETFSAKSREVSTDSMKVSARLDVLLVDDEKATVEALVLGTKGKSTTDHGSKTRTYETAAGDWEYPVPGVILMTGRMGFDTQRVPFPPKCPSSGFPYGCFVQIPPRTVRLKEKWTADSPDPRDQETLQVTSLAIETSGTVAKLEGKTDNKQDVLDSSGIKCETITNKGTSKSEFDLEGGYLRSRESTLVTETTLAGKTTPCRRTTEKKSMTLKPTTPEKK